MVKICNSWLESIKLLLCLAFFYFFWRYWFLARLSEATEVCTMVAKARMILLRHTLIKCCLFLSVILSYWNENMTCLLLCAWNLIVCSWIYELWFAILWHYIVKSSELHHFAPFHLTCSYSLLTGGTFLLSGTLWARFRLLLLLFLPQTNSDFCYCLPLLPPEFSCSSSCYSSPRRNSSVTWPYIPKWPHMFSGTDHSY